MKRPLFEAIIIHMDGARAIAYISCKAPSQRVCHSLTLNACHWSCWSCCDNKVRCQQTMDLLRSKTDSSAAVVLQSTWASPGVMAAASPGLEVLTQRDSDLLPFSTASDHQHDRYNPSALFRACTLIMYMLALHGDVYSIDKSSCFCLAQIEV